MAKILITGGAGNFGRTVAQALRGAGHSLKILDLPGRDFHFCDHWTDTRVVKGDILDADVTKDAVSDVEWIFHLAAILPPASEKDRERTFLINMEGTRRLIAAGLESAIQPTVVLATSVSVYGDTSAQTLPVSPDQVPNPNDWYAASKVEAEKILMTSGLPWINLRISAIVIPEFLDPPDPWPFMPEQRIELVASSDLVLAMIALIHAQEALGRTLIISGGPTWQVDGERYVRRWAEIMEIPFEEMNFMARPGWLNWYDTTTSQALLGYQRTSLEDFFRELEQAVAAALA